MNWREYHESTKHTVESLRRTRHVLDWANMPDPFRHYEGAPLLDLPADPPFPEIPASDVLHGAMGAAACTTGAAFLSALLYHSMAVSASKLVPSTGYRYALRVNPSSGNLHPTETHFVTRGLAEWPDGLYHYRPSSHMAEQRAAGELAGLSGETSLVFVLTSIVWREAWKYRSRAYRYCLLDMGHAWQSIALAARAMGCEVSAAGHFSDDDLARTCRLHDDEWPMMVLTVNVPRGLLRAPDVGGVPEWLGGVPNRLSNEVEVYERIDSVHAATKRLARASQAKPEARGSGAIELPSPVRSAFAFGEVARTRRSALDFQGGARSITLPQLSSLLASTHQPMHADFLASRFIQLHLYVHRLEGLDPGVYRYWPDAAQLERTIPGDQRVMAAGLSLGQDLAGNACVAFSMIADIDRAARSHGDRGYRYVHFEAGAIGQRLYLAAEAMGLRATGIGAFYDDEVDRYLHLTPDQGQVVYHFAIGHPVHDPRVNA